MKQININNRTYYFLNGINIKKFDSDLLNIDKKSYKNANIYYIGYIPMKNTGDYENIDSVNRLYFIIGEVDGYIEESNGNKYFTFASTKNTELWNGIKNLIKK